MSLYLYSPPNCEKTAHLPCKSDAQRQGYGKWMLCTVGLNGIRCWDVIVQARFQIDLQVRYYLVLYASADSK